MQGWWNWGVLYVKSEKILNFTLRDLKNGERAWNVSIADDIAAADWPGFQMGESIAIDAGGFSATIEFIRERVAIPTEVLDFYNQLSE